MTPDEEDMQRMGKAQVTRVSFVLSYVADGVLIGFTTIMLNSWESLFP
jgi:choline transport protein